MTFRIGPSHCGECGNDYGHDSGCSKSSDRPENWPVSKKVFELSKSPAPTKDRLEILMRCVIELAEQVERGE